ncbi:spore protease YyaC [Paenibacillus hamazuiensis]|uniref:spore protease YyaC n=1 Tax=Paenibacillus hamazuiensis TaxID=2936508 RepID=UPI00200BBBA9|nr:spore protease YyaC [Paenibacillus hamazuiensis]
MMYHKHYLDKKSVAYFSEALVKHFLKNPAYAGIAVVCIGTNRYNGDSLGPMVGSRLAERFENHRQVRVYGTLDSPVHALNLQKAVAAIAEAHKRSYIIAVDACLGQFYKIGTIQLVDEPLEPGVSLGKQLPPIGHIHLKGIINNYGPLNHKVLEHTSLTFVGEMAVVMSRILVKACQDIIPHLSAAEPAAHEAANKRSSGS